MVFESLMLGLLPLPHTQLYSDQTARGGGTRVLLVEEADGLRLSGTLLGVVGREGTRVGFVGLRRSLTLQDACDLHIRVEGVEELKVRAVFKTTHTRVPPFEGDLTFQTLLEATAERDVYKISLAKLEPTIRGRLIQGPLPFPFKPTEVREFSVELKLSEQEFDPARGLPFELKVFFSL